MHDQVDIRRRIDRLVARVDRRDDYGQLLTYGQTIHRLEDVEDIEAWRAEIKRQARANKIKVRTKQYRVSSAATSSRDGRPHGLGGLAGRLGRVSGGALVADPFDLMALAGVDEQPKHVGAVVVTDGVEGQLLFRDT